MAAYAAPVDDIAFLLGKVFDFDRCMAELPGHEDVNTELAVSVLEEAGKFASEVLEPLNRPGDRNVSMIMRQALVQFKLGSSGSL